GVHRRRLARVRVADERDRRKGDRGALVAVEPAGPFDVAQPAVELADARPHATAVHLELGLARAARAHAAAEPREVRPLARETRQQVLELGELDLHLALEASRPLREDVEDERAPAADLPVELTLDGRATMVSWSSPPRSR